MRQLFAIALAAVLAGCSGGVYGTPIGGDDPDAGPADARVGPDAISADAPPSKVRHAAAPDRLRTARRGE